MNTHNLPNFIHSLSQNFTPVVSAIFLKEDYVAIDLSETNTALDSVNVSSSVEFEDYISEYVKINEAKVAYGGYNEVRGIYRRSTHFNQENPETERNIHLGIDIWCNAGTEILAPLDGKVHSFKNNTNFGDYGPTIILEHECKGIQFFTLYGHLSLPSIEKLIIGQAVKAGDVIAYLGDASVNGDYAPHLHFQVILDMQGYFGDYPGVSNKKDLEFYLRNCPDPSLLLKIE
ncbi:peptidoglycan DD-metalloendopeptidase family protein [Aquimarina sp. AU474]|uniref:peptidoglycan DD-metalloendopeptidase family protein n=1 Tax=Aquimarina sp. AU474 TaxID=2108529 RepID=UPI000D685554|nr:peptidoglycan DD-metalloendopeptidase family protein [Aquimarina sp. AU474]